MIYLSVGEILEMTLRSGSIDSRFTGKKRALQGTKLHQRLQKRHKKAAKAKKLNYESEVSLSYTFSFKSYDFTVSGRADGLIRMKNKIIIEEIKSTAIPLDEIDAPTAKKHLAQAKLYAYMYAEKYHISEFDIYLTYCSLKGEEKSLNFSFTYSDLKDFFYEIMESFYKWTEKKEELDEKFKESLLSLSFPYPNFRQGQRELSVAVYKTLVSEKKLFACAPTGIGKTLGVIFPTLKYMGTAKGKDKRIFYLTSKNTLKALAETALSIMREKGLFILSTTLTAKEKICLNDETVCNPVKCPYAKGHFDRVNDCIWDILNAETVITADTIKTYAESHKVCPFELSLDLTLFSHFIICDYNYAFDPTARLERFFEADRNEDYIALIDEAHNLPSRSRDMYTAEFKKSEVLALVRGLKNTAPALTRSLRKINAYMLKEKREIENELVSDYNDDKFLTLLSSFTQAAESWLEKNEGSPVYDQTADLCFKALDFQKISEFFDPHFSLIKESFGTDFKITVFCKDSSAILKELSKSFKSMVFFTATFKPIEYFTEILGGSFKTDNRIEILSPFPRENLCVICDNSISTLYKDRENSLRPIADRIHAMTAAKRGNYLCFFPSYEYMENVYEAYTALYSTENTLLQQRSSTDIDRTEFLESFSESSALTGFCVLGGVFSEGVDLKGSRLIGCAVIGVGLPKTAIRQNIIRSFFDNQDKDGFAYAYAYPGMIKAAQAGGRVIRSETDKGVVLLLDRRFSTPFYSALLPTHWRPIQLFGSQSIKQVLNNFWNEKVPQ
ncbi:MAG: ATP-dependent DNA helicase [Eubacterium sp.]|nr:ATP-dependent DNA helicase [Eubacterium sp.]